MGDSDYLFAKPSFLGGIASILDLGGTLQLYNESLTPTEADSRAIMSDFLAVGGDIQSATDEVSKEYGTK